MDVLLTYGTVLVIAASMAVPVRVGVGLVRAVRRPAPGSYAALRRAGMDKRTARACSRVLVETGRRADT